MDKLKAQNGHAVLVHITCKFADGKVVDSTYGSEPLLFKIGDGRVIPELEQAMIGMTSGETKTIRISAEKARSLYGIKIPALFEGQLLFDSTVIEIIPADGSFVDQLYEKGLLLQSRGYLNEAITCFKKVIQVNPSFLNAYYSLGILLQHGGHVEDAITLFRKVLSLCPNHSETHNILGSAYQQKDSLDDAALHYHKAIQYDGNAFRAHNNLGSVLRLQGDLVNAIKHYQIALKLNPDFTEAYNNLGNALRDRNELDKAIQMYREAIKRQTNFADAHWNLSYALLLSGQFEEGWEEYEWRWKIKVPQHTLPQPLWDGSDISGQTILLYAEQGLGDTIQFIRYASKVAEKGAKVIVGCQRRLKALLKNVLGVNQVIAFREKLPQFDIRCPILSLPRVFRTRIDNIPSQVPYIQIDAEKIEPWKEKIRHKDSKLNVGLAWAGSPGHLNDRNRSCSLEIFLPLAQIQDIALYSLQKEIPAQWPKDSAPDMDLIDYTKEIKDFADTAGLIMNLDLIISVDTAVAHLAGALEKPVWILLPFAPDWRWMLDRVDTPWYPTMKLFRQPKPGDWKAVINGIYQQLLVHIGNRIS